MKLRDVIVCSLALACFAAPVAADPIKVALLPAGTTDVAVVAGGTATTRNLLFCGFSSLETGGSNSSTVRVYNGEDATGELIFAWSLTASESRSEGPWSPTDCILAPDGIFLDRGGSGTTLVTVYYRTRFN